MLFKLNTIYGSSFKKKGITESFELPSDTLLLVFIGLFQVITPAENSLQVVVAMSRVCKHWYNTIASGGADNAIWNVVAQKLWKRNPTRIINWKRYVAHRLNSAHRAKPIPVSAIIPCRKFMAGEQDFWEKNCPVYWGILSGSTCSQCLETYSILSTW